MIALIVFLAGALPIVATADFIPLPYRVAASSLSAGLIALKALYTTPPGGKSSAKASETNEATSSH